MFPESVSGNISRNRIPWQRIKTREGFKKIFPLTFFNRPCKHVTFHLNGLNLPPQTSLVYSSVVVSTPALLCNRPPGGFLLAKLKTLCPSNVNPPPQLQPLATPFLLSAFLILTSLGISYKWDHTVFVLLCLAYCTGHNAQ